MMNFSFNGRLARVFPESKGRLEENREVSREGLIPLRWDGAAEVFRGAQRLVFGDRTGRQWLRHKRRFALPCLRACHSPSPLP